MKYLKFPLDWFGSKLTSIRKIEGSPGSFNGYQFKGTGWLVIYERRNKSVEQIWVKGQMISSKTYKK
ncbi:hypothetical protein LCGC14_2114310 [marine sediment metagenome]|uniref:Uncharacterized protein n=1 Tax=marine sediment metagenome TaxID=412755 RepID=A0A0F9GJ84_9ZZZZ